MLDTDENSGTSGWLYYFRYIPYLFLALLCYVMGYVLMAFKKDDIPKRMQASVISARRQSLEGLLAMFIMGGGLVGESVWLEPSLCMEKYFSVQKISDTMY